METPDRRAGLKLTFATQVSKSNALNILNETTQARAHHDSTHPRLLHRQLVSPERHLHGEGVLDDPEATARAMDPQGWLHTGDIAVVDDDGFVYIVDRAKDLIIVSGFNVFPAEVERVLNAHPGVVESGVVGVPHPHTGESVKAFIVAEPGRVLEEDDLIEWCATELARYKCPTKIDLVDEIPRGLGGKIIRRELGA